MQTARYEWVQPDILVFFGVLHLTDYMPGTLNLSLAKIVWQLLSHGQCVRALL